MFSSSPNYNKLKTNLRLAITRLKLLEKKKIELAQKSRKEIADYIKGGKVERARIRVEHIIREDYLVEAMEMLEMYCDLLLARMGVIQQMRAVDGGLEEAVSTILWAGPRIVADVPELKVICDQLTLKYGRDYSDTCKDNSNPSISQKFKQRIGVQAPPKVLVEKYLVEISNNFNVLYQPDEQVLKGDSDGLLIDLGDQNNVSAPEGSNIPQPPGFKVFPPPPMLPPSDFQPRISPDSGNESSSSPTGGFVVPPAADNPHPGYTSYGVPFYYPLPMDEEILKYTRYPKNYEPRQPIDSSDYQVFGEKEDLKEKPPLDLGKIFAELPKVPTHSPHSFKAEDAPVDGQKTSIDIEFENLSKRFEELKKKK